MDKNTDRAGNVVAESVFRVILASVTPDMVLSAYSGRQGCMCGCRGRYSVNPAHKAEADKGRGYEMPAARNLAQIKKALRLLQSDPRTRVQDGHILYLAGQDPGERSYVVYLCKAASF